jgi:hypothetical protein
VKIATVSFTGPINNMVNTITSALASYWPVIAGLIGGLIALAFALRALERWTQDTFNTSLFFDDDDLDDRLERELLEERLELLDGLDAADIDGWNELMIAEQSVWHVGSWDELDVEDGWEWTGDRGELAGEAMA